MTLTSVPNAKKDRSDPSLTIIGLKGVPAEMLLERARGTDYEKEAQEYAAREAELDRVRGEAKRGRRSLSL